MPSKTSNGCAYHLCEHGDVRKVTVSIQGEKVFYVHLCEVHRRPLDSLLRAKAAEAERRANKPKRLVWDDDYVESLVERHPGRWGS